MSLVARSLGEGVGGGGGNSLDLVGPGAERGEPEHSPLHLPSHLGLGCEGSLWEM